MKLPRSLSGVELAKALHRVGYETIRQTGSHIRMTRRFPSEHHITIPAHSDLKVGTLASVLSDIAEHLKMDRMTLMETLFK